MSERFWSKVQKTETCWLWKGAVRNFHGAFWLNGRLQAAHRVSFQLAKGPIPAGLSVCHTCDIGICVNPDHLFLGTHKDNMDDRDAKGRTPVGERVGGARLTWELVRRMRQGDLKHLREYQLAKMLQIPRSTIGCAMRGESWNLAAYEAVRGTK